MHTDVHQLQKDLERKIYTLETISEFSRALNMADNLKKVCDIIMLTCMGYKGIEMTALLLEKEDLSDAFSVEFVRGADPVFEGETVHLSSPLLEPLNQGEYANCYDEDPETAQVLESLNCHLLMPIFYQDKLIGVLSCGPRIAGMPYQDEDIEFLQLVANHAGIGIHNILMLEHLESNNIALEKKVFELEAIDEINQALTSSLDMEKVCHTLILTIMGYLTAELALFYVLVPHDEDADASDAFQEFRLASCIGTQVSKSFQKFRIETDALNQIRNHQMIRKDNEVHELFSLLFENLDAELSFLVVGSGEVLGIAFFGGKLTGIPYKKQELELANLMVRQGYSPIRNSQFHSQICEYNQKLEQKVEARTAELSQANMEISLLNEQLKEENLRMGAELDVARKLQRMVLPTDEELKKVKELDISCFMEPADEVGGDYYDVFQDNETLRIGIGDVSGHGLESGVIMLMTQTAIRTLALSDINDPVRFLNILNRVIYNNIQRMKADKSLTLVMLDYTSCEKKNGGKLRLSGQHEEMILVRKDGRLERIDTLDLGMFIGMVEDIAEFVAESFVTLQEGDGIVLYTDGITEAQNANDEFYGMERLCHVIKSHWDEPAEAIRAAVIEDVRQFIGKHIVYDDITLLVMKQR